MLSIGCEKEQHELDTSANSYELENRSSEDQITSIEELKEFQTYMRNIHLLQTTGGASAAARIAPKYTVEQVVSGTEFLLNLKYGRKSRFSGRLATKISKVHSNEFEISSTSNGIDLVNVVREDLARQAAIYQRNRTASIIAYDIHVLEEKDNIYVIGADILVEDIDECALQSGLGGFDSGNSCNEPFDINESFYVGAWGYDGYEDVTEDIVSDLDCLEKCGGVGPCSTVQNTAFEQLESRLESAFNEPSCPDGQIWTGTYSNIETGSYSFEGGTFSSFDCIDPLLDEIANNGCNCLDSDILNCIYCGLYDSFVNRANNIPNIDIPAGAYVFYIDAATDMLLGTDPSSPTVRPEVKYSYGIPVCVDRIDEPYEDHILMMPLDNYGGGN